MDMVKVGKRLVDLRGKRTQREVAKAMDINLSTYAMYEIGKRVPSDENKVKIANYYKRTVQYIFFRQ